MEKCNSAEWKAAKAKGGIAEREALYTLCRSFFGCGVKADKRGEHREGEMMLDNSELVEVKFDGRFLDTHNVCVEKANNSPERNGFNVGWFYDCEERGVDWLMYALYKPCKGGWKLWGAVAIYFPLFSEWVHKNQEVLDKEHYRHNDTGSCFWIIPLKMLIPDNVVMMLQAHYAHPDYANEKLTALANEYLKRKGIDGIVRNEDVKAHFRPTID